jgi:DNA-binding HxlR family transcriptional regulator
MRSLNRLGRVHRLEDAPKWERVQDRLTVKDPDFLEAPTHALSWAKGMVHRWQP